MNRIVLLASAVASTNIVYNALAREHSDIVVIIEKRVPHSQLLKRRIKKLGLVRVIGQVLFMLLVERPLRKFSTHRIAEINAQFGLDDTFIAGTLHYVDSVNADETRAILQQLNPALVVVNATRIISQQILDAVTARFINIHAGITPTYRGVHGGYWALVEGRPDLAGTTVHIVDKGIDTGKVIKQAIFKATPDDSIVTYPFLQLAVGVPILVQTVQEVLQGKLILQEPLSSLPSQLHSHPTLWEYWMKRISRGVK